jgi:uncharacterized protein (DUF1501 family)
MQIRRRSFLRYASLAAAGNLAGLRPFGALNALANTTPDYKALVCIFLFGGNDANNMVVPYDTQGYANYASLRANLALSQSSLLGLTPTPNFALHPSLPDVQTLYNSGNAALVTNVGTLTQPITRAQVLAGGIVPTNLYSHPDQQEEWQNAAASGATATGWAGRVSDVMAGSYNSGAQIPMIVSVDGCSATVFRRRRCRCRRATWATRAARRVRSAQRDRLRRSRSSRSTQASHSSRRTTRSRRTRIAMRPPSRRRPIL